MADTKPLSSPSIATLHIIALMRWDREWYDTFEVRQARMLDDIAALLEQMGDTSHDTLRHFILGGQTVIVEDVATIRPDLVALLVIYNASGRLGLGPWYIQVDQNLVSGESLIRNLLTARIDATKHGLKLLPIGFIPDQSTHVAQLPQILRGFNISTAMLNLDDPYRNRPFYWQSPDDTALLVVGHDTPPVWTTNRVEKMHESLQAQRNIRHEGPYLWLIDHKETKDTASATLNHLQQLTDMPTSQIDIVEYLSILRRNLTETLHGTITGELLPQALKQATPGNLSTRLYLKQEHVRLQSKLTHAVEPWLTVALTHGKITQPVNPQALLHHCWRLLLKNQSTHALGGTASDEVHANNEAVYRRIDDSSDHIINTILQGLPGTPLRQGQTSVNPNPNATTYAVVWNPHNWSHAGVVTLPLTLPEGRYPYKVRVPGSDDALAFAWEPAEHHESHSGTITFLATAPAVGYCAYTIELSEQPVNERHFKRESTSTSIGNIFGDTLFVEDGKLNWKREDDTIEDILRFIDMGDAGDAYNYARPEEDVAVQAMMVNDVKTVSTPVYEQLIINHRMRIATGLNDDLTRSRGVRLVELQTTATFYDHVPGVYFHTTFDNNAQDHRLRAHIRTNIDSSHAYAQGVFNIDRYKVGKTFGMQGITAVHDGALSLGLMSRGLPEVQSEKEDDAVTLALTLTRAVGWLSREQLPERDFAMGPVIPVAGAQCQREISAEYALISTPPGNRAALLRHSQMYNAPLQAYQYDIRPSRPRRSYLSIMSDQVNANETGDSDGAGVIMTSFKPPVKGRGWLLRLYNPHPHDVEVFITPHTRPEQVHRSTLSEDSVKFLETDLNGRIQLTLRKHEIATLRLLF